MIFHFENREISIDLDKLNGEITDEDILSFLKILSQDKLEIILTEIENL